MTVNELRKVLDLYPGDLTVLFRHDECSTYKVDVIYHDEEWETSEKSCMIKIKPVQHGRKT